MRPSSQGDHVTNLMLQKKKTAKKPRPLLTGRVGDLDDEARGIVQVEDRCIYIDGVLPGETVTFQCLRKRQGKMQGRAMAIDMPSSLRVNPPCSQAGICGGCRLQHMDYGAQLEYKADILRRCLEVYPNVRPRQWLPVLTAAPFGYRRRARLSVRYYERDDEIRVGFRARYGGYVLALHHCPVLEDRVARLLPSLHELIHGLSCRDRIPQVEVSVGDEETALVVRHLVPLTAEDEAALRGYGQAHDLSIHVQPKGPDTCTRLSPVETHGLSYRLPGHEVEIHFTPVDFIQVNAGVNRLMVDQALDLLAPQKDEVILDLFCGLGNFSLPLARRCAHVVGADFSPALIHKAQQNARRNGIDNAIFVEADLSEDSSAVLWAEHRPHKVMLDPARSGALAILRAMPQDGPRRIVYVSCNPETLARDADCLVNEKGYAPTHAGVIDMFPHTNHIESMMVFDKS